MKLIRVGAVGTAIAALGCFTPLLVVLLGAIGLSGVVSWLDYVLVPAMVIFGGVTVYAFIRRRRGTAAPEVGGGSP